MEHARARTRAPEIEHSDNLARLDPREQRGRPPQPHIDGRRWIADNFERRRNVPELEGHAHAPFDNVIAGDSQPEQRSQRNGQNLEAKMAEWMISQP
jgi:hypothetical protein